MKIGFTTVTFRGKSVEENISLAVQAKADGLELGGDVHVPPGDLAAAEKARRQCEENNLAVLSYGSYYSCKDGEDRQAVIDVAVRLGAPVIRVWAYDKSPEEITPEEWGSAARNLRRFCEEAGDKGIRVGLEYHRGTLTEASESALRLIREVGASNLYAYWQPNPELTPEEHLREIRELSPHLVTFHVFNWHRENGEDVRYPLEENRALWESYIKTALECGGVENLILEFVKDDSEELLLADTATLRAIRET